MRTLFRNGALLFSRDRKRLLIVKVSRLGAFRLGFSGCVTVMSGLRSIWAEVMRLASGPVAIHAS